MVTSMYDCIKPQESKKADTVETHQLPGVDAKLKILFAKVGVCIHVRYYP